MGSNHHLSLTWMWMILCLASISSSSVEGQGTMISTRLLDLVIRDYTFKSFNNQQHLKKTGTPYKIDLPLNLTGIRVFTSRYRCGSLRRYGATVNEFYLKVGVEVHPCIERILIVTQNLGNNWSSIYYNDEDALLGYQLVSPVLGLLAYNSGGHDTQFEVKIRSPTAAGIQINFSNYVDTSTNGRIKLCATFAGGGGVKLEKEVAPNICGVRGHGHFGVVVQSPLLPVRKKMMRQGWTLAFGCSVGAAIAIFLAVLLLVAMFVKVKKKARLEEMERRAYEEEALQVSMVGHTTRNAPRIEHALR